MVIHILTITTKYGNNVYAAKTKTGITRLLADYARQYWGEVLDYDDIPESDDDVIEKYFELQNELENEYYQIDQTELAE
jgi:hypothetical protein